MAGFNQKEPRSGKRTTGRQRTMCRRTEGQLFPEFKNGRGRGQSLVRGAGAVSGSEGKPGVRNEGSDDLKSLKEQYELTKENLNSIERKIKDLESEKESNV